MGRPAIFLDRDGTVIEDRHYLADPEGVRLLPGAATALRRLQAAGYLLVLATNQSGVGRGYFPVGAMHAVHERLAGALAAEGVRLDGIYHCPHAPDAACQCRKPRPGMLLDAAADLEIDLARSWMIGDKPADVAAGRAAGARALQVGVPDCPDLETAADVVLGEQR